MHLTSGRMHSFLCASILTYTLSTSISVVLGESEQDNLVKGHLHIKVSQHAEEQTNKTKYLLYEVDENLAINDGHGYSHQVHGIACAMLEAKTFNRTLILPDALRLQAQHSFNGWFAKPIGEIFNLTQLQNYVPIIFTENPNAHVRGMVMGGNKMELVVRQTMYQRDLAQHGNIDIITRPQVGYYKNWFEWCYKFPEDPHQDLPVTTDDAVALLEAFRATDTTLELVRKMRERMGEACGLHVRRGDKARDRKDIDEATQPDNILKKLEDRCPPGKTLYIASNENKPGFFDPLKEHYKLYTYRDFLDLLEPAGIVKKEQDASIIIVDNFTLFQIDLEILLEATPFMDTFCVLYYGTVHDCNLEFRKSKNGGAYGFDDTFPNHRGGMGLIGG